MVPIGREDIALAANETEPSMQDFVSLFVTSVNKSKNFAKF